MSKQTVGPVTPSGTASAPSRCVLEGRYTALIPLELSHADPTWRHLGGSANGHLWTYMFGGPYLKPEEWREAVEGFSKTEDPLFYTVLSGPRNDPQSEPVGQMSFLNIVPSHRRIEIGSIIFGAQLKQTRAATEAFYLIIKYAFDDLGYLRVEWKANHLNKPSLAAAERLGFVFEGIFRKHMILKGRRRDTAWFSITDDEWPLVKKSFEAWLSEENFDKDGKQIKSLKEIRQNFAEEEI
ncbi:related to GNAT family acetyltransferase [Fusarium torulosum]|uniref:Related to GNAT family acetyltransferase n=1 Tax=Fusarium torulosum TaxID=33205 RepID=A0AAE8SNM2_9HYPO|nr:related to GNAT family acetyltransferase [Fusarium torulosum]